MQLAVVAAGFTPGEADQLRRAMGAWRRPGIIDQFRTRLLDGMAQHGLTGEFAERVFEQIRGFGEYGFPESHAASFALLVYVSAWLKHYYPAAFCASLINSQPMGFYAPSQLVRDARDHGVGVHPADVNESGWDCTLDGTQLRLGLRLIGGLPEVAANDIAAARAGGPFTSLEDLAARANLPPAVVERLANADALASIALPRRNALWKALAVKQQPKQRTLFDDQEIDEAPADLPAMSPQDEVHADYKATGLSLKAHPMSFQRERLTPLGIVQTAMLATLPNESRVRVAGIVILRQRPSTAKGITFVTIEDETGTANLVVHTGTWERFREITRHSQAWIVHGRLERKDAVIHVVVRRLENMAERLQALPMKSRDFR